MSDIKAVVKEEEILGRKGHCAAKLVIVGRVVKETGRDSKHDNVILYKANLIVCAPLSSLSDLRTSVQNDSRQGRMAKN